jgi:hypothetical protein
LSDQALLQPHRTRRRGQELTDPSFDRLVEVCRRHDVLDQSPSQRLARRESFAEQQDFARAAPAGQQRK